MLIQCNNKGCMASTEAQLDTETMEVICLACEKPITGVSESMIRVLKSSGQIVRDRIRKAFTMACMKCYANREVVLNTAGETVCGVCLEPITVHVAMRLAMEETGAKLRRLTAEEEAAKSPEVQAPATVVKKKKTTRKRKRRRTSKKKVTKKTT